jgi:phage tail P2-like protein
MSGGMTLQTLEFVRLLPQFMRGDLAVLGLSKALDEIVPGLSRSLQRLTTWDKINSLSESELDELAVELNILWYDRAANIDAKRDVIRNSDMVYKKLGTKWAVENVVQSYFGDGSIIEWWEYGGEPGHFRVTSANPSLNTEKFAEFLNILQKVKRASSHLDSVLISLAGKMPVSFGVAVHESIREHYTATVGDGGKLDTFAAVGVGDTIQITTTAEVTTDGDTIVINTSLPAYADGDTIVIGY